MAVLQYLGQVPAQWFDASGNAALAGGKIAFYEVGTTTPKTVYSDYQGNTSAGTTVTLDSSGRANIWLAGLYSVQLSTAANVPIGNRIDGIGTELAPDVDASAVLSVETYDDLRALTGANVRICGVEGRDANGDGGAGMFAWDDAETAVDDGGTILTPDTLPVSGRWVRIFSGDMDFRWFGDITGTDDTTAYAVGLAASASRKRWLSISDGTVRLTSSVSAPAGSMVRIPMGGQIVAASSLVALGFPAGTLFDGSPDCFGENITVSFGLNAVPAVDVTWWDTSDDDTRLIEACDACADANMEVLIPRAMGLTADFTQPPNAVLNFQGPGKLAWSDTGAVNIVLRRWKTDANEFPRFTFSTVAKLNALTMVESQGVYLSPRLFGAIGNGSTDDAAAVWPVLLHGWGWIDQKYLVSSSLTKTGSVYLRGPLTNARAISDASFVPHGLFLGSGVDLTVSEYLSIAGTCIEATNAAQSTVEAGLRLTLHNAALFGQSNAGVASLGVECYGADIADAQAKNAPIYTSANGLIRDSDVYGSATYDVAAVSQVGLGGSAWEITRSYIEKASTFGASRIESSAIDGAGALEWSDGAICIASTIAPVDATSAGTTNGNLQIIGGDVSLPLIGDDAHTIALSGFLYTTVMPWNGYGTVTLAGGSETLNNGGTSDANALRRGATVLDGVTCPRSRASNMGAAEYPTSSTASWAFGGGSTPSVSTDTFDWSSGIAGAGTNTLTKTIGTNVEKILAAYGGYVIAEWTGDIDSVACILGVEDITVSKCPGATAQQAVYHIWPGAYTATTGYQFRIVHGGGAATLRITVQPCAPVNVAQWEAFWGGDRTLSASRLNTWRGTYTEGDDCDGLEVLVDQLPGYPYTPALQTLAPWLLVFTPPVQAYPRNPNYINNLLTGNVFKAFKETSGTTFHPQASGAYP